MKRHESTKILCFEDMRTREPIQRAANAICEKIQAVLSESRDKGISVDRVSAAWHPSPNERFVGVFDIYFEGKKNQQASPQPI